MKQEDKHLQWLKRNENPTDEKIDYVLNSPIGTIVAFDTKSEGTKSGAIMKRILDEDQVLVEVETEYGAKYIIPSREVLWVKTGSRWPKWVYEKFKA